jgi:hypothetical protein
MKNEKRTRDKRGCIDHMIRVRTHDMSRARDMSRIHDCQNEYICSIYVCRVVPWYDES